MNKSITVIFAVFLMLSTGAFGQTKCIDTKGKVSYSDVPCPTNSVQKSMNLGGTGGQTSQGGDGTSSTPALDKLVNERRRLEWIVKGAESDMRMTGSHDDARKLSIANADLIRVQEQILQIKDPASYQQYLKDKKEKQRDQQLADTQRSANEANARAAAAMQSANNANARAENADARASAAQQDAAAAQNAAAVAKQNAAAARGAAAAAQGAASRPLYCKGNYCY